MRRPRAQYQATGGARDPEPVLLLTGSAAAPRSEYLTVTDALRLAGELTAAAGEAIDGERRAARERVPGAALGKPLRKGIS